MARLELSLLGPPIVARQGQPVNRFALQKARALLLYLAMEREREHPREALVGLLWPDQPEASARANLRQALANLRDAIGDEGVHPPFLSIHRETIRFHLSQADWLDVVEFSALLEECAAHRHRHDTRCGSCARRRERAVALVRGEFLAGFHVREAGPFDEWAAIQRERLHRRMVDAMGRLAAFYEGAGDLDRAQEMVGRRLELDPWMEEAHQERMRLLARSGRRSEALSQFEACRRALAEDLKVEPSAETVHLYQRIRDGLPDQPWEGAERPKPHRLPQPTTPFVGRRRALEALTDLLEDPDHRLVTITGPGGVGKTRLAVAVVGEVAGSFADGAVFVSLTALDAPKQIPGAILMALDVPQTDPMDPWQLVLQALRQQERLLVLDGVEHLVDGARQLLMELLPDCAGTTVLATSQERLGLQSEWRYELEGLEIPADLTQNGLLESEAVRLFLERGRQVDHRLGAATRLAEVARICRAVEGMPLAIELAASTADVRSLAQIADDLEADTRSLASRHLDLPERQRSLAATFEYSWNLLEERRRQVLRRLSVFRGGWDQEAAEAVAACGADDLAALADRSLIRSDRSGRFEFHPLLRRFAGGRLQESGEEPAVRDGHLAYCLRLAETAAPHFAAQDQVTWLGRIDANLANFREALAWGVENQAGDVASGLCLALARYWMIRGHLTEGQRWIDTVLATPPGPAPSARAKLHNRAGILAAMQRRFDQAEAHLVASVELSRKLGDRLGEVTSRNSLGAMSIEREQYARARDYLEACLPAWDELGNTNGLASSLNNLGVVALMSGEPEAAYGRFEEALLLFRQLGDRRMIAGVLHNIGDLQIKTGRPDSARTRFRESLELRSEIGEVGAIAESLEGLAAVAVEAERAGEAARLYGAASVMRQAVGAPIAPVNQPDVERFVARARRLLGESAFAQAWEEGRTLDPGEASALARSI